MSAPTTDCAHLAEDTADTLVVSGIGIVEPPEDPEGEWFDYRVELGAQGYKYVPRASQYLLAASRRALADAGLSIDGPDDECGVALGSNNCASQLHAEIDRQLHDTGIRFLRPAIVPFFSVNLFLARLGIEHGWRGFSLALHSPRIAGLEAIERASLAIRRGRSSWAVVGAIESPLDPSESGAAQSEDGAVVLTMESARRVIDRPGGRTYGTLRARSLFVSPRSPGRPDSELSDRLSELAASLDVRTGTPTVLIADESAVAEAVAGALAPTETVVAGPGCLSPMLAVARALLEGSGPRLIACASADGNVALAAASPPSGHPTQEGAR